MYLPNITDAKHASSWVIGPFLSRVLTECESEGHIEYVHVMFVYSLKPQEDNEQLEVVFAIAAERNTMMPDGDACFLGVFGGTGHANMGSSEEWADLDKFTNKALEVVKEHFKVKMPPRQIPAQAS